MITYYAQYYPATFFFQGSGSNIPNKSQFKNSWNFRKTPYRSGVCTIRLGIEREFLWQMKNK